MNFLSPFGQSMSLAQFCGMRVVSSPFIEPVPKLQLSHDFNACSLEMKAGMNKWLLDRFGTRDVAFLLGNNTVALNPKHLAMLQAEIGRRNRE